MWSYQEQEGALFIDMLKEPSVIKINADNNNASLINTPVISRPHHFQHLGLLTTSVENTRQQKGAVD